MYVSACIEVDIMPEAEILSELTSILGMFSLVFSLLHARQRSGVITDRFAMEAPMGIQLFHS